MEKLIAYLGSRRKLNILLIIVYFIFLLAMHDFVVSLSVWVMNSLTRQVYDLIIGVIMLTAMALIMYLFVKNLRINKHATDIKIFYMLILTGLFVVHTQMNFVMNIEVIHMLQFGVIAVLIFPITRSFGATLYFTVILGLIDELFQYAVLYPGKNDYLDFNDIVLDQLGAAMILVYLCSTGIESYQKESAKWYKSPVIISAVAIAAIVGGMFHFSLLSVYYNPDAVKPILTLSESLGPEGFWRHLPNCNIVYHVMSPLEGVTVIALLCGLFYLLDYLNSRSSKESHQSGRGTTSMQVVPDENELNVKSVYA